MQCVDERGVTFVVFIRTQSHDMNLMNSNEFLF